GNYPAFGSIPDRVARCGPLGGLYSVAMQMPDGPAWVVPVDTPNVTPALLQRLRARPTAACTLFAGEPLPMRLQIDDRCRRVLQELIENPTVHRSIRAVQERLGAIELPLGDSEHNLLLNCNTPAELELFAS
ncbi:NTP transferase domain-containing protein, partial [Stenotrophomonas sp. G106K1]|uniref:molybdenum cofactor guanylyltransferase n=1 Tax=Stenotrophomonas sp. G106K1 TaxID=3134792 RepID=UPI0030F499E1